MEENARQYIATARELSSCGSYKKAFDMYLVGFSRNPDLRNIFELEFYSVLHKLNDALGADQRNQDIFTNFGRAMEVFPNNVNLLNDIGKYLHEFGFHSEAWGHFQKALRLDYTFVDPEKNLNSIKNLMMERWHFRMLNDKNRNEAYRSALHDTITPSEETVLDIGTGTGLLAFYASECSPRKVAGCDSSEVMAGLAEDIATDNQKTEVEIINKKSTTLVASDIGGYKSLIVTEMFDAGLFGEHVLQTLAHAWENLMTKNAKVIPKRAEFFVTAAYCKSLHLKYQLRSSSKALLGVPDLNVNVDTFEETYDCEDVHFYKDIEYLVEPESLVKVDFNDYDNIQKTLKQTAPYQVKFKTKKAGKANVIIGWFDLHLTDKISITTNPMAHNRSDAWQQAVFYDNTPKMLKEDDVFNVDFLNNSGKLGIHYEHDDDIMRISPEVMRFLNDSDLLKIISNCIATVYIYLGQIADVTTTSIVDLCPFPWFGLLMMKRGAQSLTCCAKTYQDVLFFTKVFEANKISIDKLTILEGNNWGKEVFDENKYHAVFSNLFDLFGDIDMHSSEMALHLREFHLCTGGLFIPVSVHIVAQVVSCPWVDVNNRVHDENVSNYKIARHINKYQVSQYFGVDFSHIGYTPLTNPLVLSPFNDDVPTHVVQIPVIESGEANAILCWYNITFLQDMEEISTNRKNSFVDGIIFIVNPKVPVECGKTVSVTHCRDQDGAFKLIIDSIAS